MRTRTHAGPLTPRAWVGTARARTSVRARARACSKKTKPRLISHGRDPLILDHPHTHTHTPAQTQCLYDDHSLASFACVFLPLPPTHTYTQRARAPTTSSCPARPCCFFDRARGAPTHVRACMHMYACVVCLCVRTHVSTKTALLGETARLIARALAAFTHTAARRARAPRCQRARVSLWPLERRPLCLLGVARTRSLKKRRSLYQHAALAFCVTKGSML
jgi:hypothetical protein